MDRANSQANTLPPKPEFKCEKCGGPLPAIQNPGWRPGSLLGSNPRLVWRPDYGEHQACLEALAAEKARAEAEAERERERLRRDSLIARCGIPATMLDRMSFDELRRDTGNETAIKALTVWNGEPYGVLLMGPPGTGKSHMLIAFAGKQLLAGRPVKFMKVYELVAEMRKQSLAGGYEPHLERIQQVPLLLLDDLGSTKETPFSIDVITTLLDFRLDARLPTFITTNCSHEDLAERLHERVYSRLKAMCFFVAVSGKDRRTNQQVQMQVEMKKKMQGVK